MKILIFSILTISLGLISCNSNGQDNPNESKFHLSKIVFHSSRCNGLCPKLDLLIDSNRNVFATREFYITKSNIDKKNSGNYQGSVSKENYDKLITALVTLNLDTLNFPEVDCCDGIVSTIIIYYNGKRKYLKSMTPPHVADRVIWLLNKIGYENNLERTLETKTIEN